jgi:hypothetical protein
MYQRCGAMKRQHYLISMDIVPHKYRIHGFLMCDDERRVTDATNKIADEAEKIADELGVGLVPVLLVTELSTGTKLVRDIVCKHSPKAKEKIRTAKDFHLTIWAWPTADNPDDACLMELH